VSGVPIALVGELVRESLAAWGVAGEATCTHDDAIVIERAADRKRVRIEPKPNDPIFRWTVAIDGRNRPAVSLLAVLRQVRAALDPDYAAARVRVSIGSLLVPS
jgi:hypothetical protein